MRAYLDGEGFLEVETPILQPRYGGGFAEPFVTHSNELDADLYLRIADELYLKRLIVGGLEKVYELGKDFRNESISYKHSPEFTQVEWYEAYADYRDTMERAEALVAAAAEAAGSRKVTFRGHEIDLSPPWQRVKFVEALEAKGVWSRDEAELRAKLEEAGVDTERDRSWSQLADHAYSHFVEPELIQPTIVYDWPIELSPFARTTDEDETLVERFEAVVGGMEFANAFSELNDAEEQAQRFAMQEAEREAGAEESEPGDPDYVEALSYGMPPTGGCGIGIDRLAMVLTGSDAIRDVILFPALRSRVVGPEQRYALDALLDALGLPFDESVPVEPAVLDEVFGLLTLAHERDAELDQHGRPLPPADPPGPRVAELAAGLGLERRGYPGGERFLVALTHDVDLLGGGGLPTAARKLAGLGRAPLAAAAARVDHVRGGRPARARSRLPARGDARRRGRPRLDLLLPHAPGGAAGRLPRALRARARAARSSERGRPGSRSGCTPPTARASGRRDRRGGAAARRGRRACATTTCAAIPPGWRRSCGRRACATTRASAGPRCRACAPGRRTRTGSGTRSGASRARGSCRSS